MDVANLAELATSLCRQDLRFKGWWLVALLQVAVYQIYLLLAELNWVTDSRTCTLLSTNVKYHHYSNSTVDPI